MKAVAILEMIIIKKLVYSFTNRGCIFTVNNGGDITVSGCDNPMKILAAMRSTDTDTLTIKNRLGKYLGGITLVYGNNGDDVISDYSTLLEKDVRPIFDWLDRFESEIDWQEFLCI